MSKTKLEYIWLDGYVPTQSLRSKTKIVKNFDGKLESCPVWCFDGSSTEQAPGGSSDCLLKPVAIFPDPARKNAYLVMNEVLSPDGTPHPSNGRALIDDDDNDFWFGSSRSTSCGILKPTNLLASRQADILHHKVLTIAL
jgi:glutamine synthetase